MVYDYIVIGSQASLTMSEYAMSLIPSKEGNKHPDISKQLILLENKWKKKRSE
jgi:hypothetical protein